MTLNYDMPCGCKFSVIKEIIPSPGWQVLRNPRNKFIETTETRTDIMCQTHQDQLDKDAREKLRSDVEISLAAYNGDD